MEQNKPAILIGRRPGGERNERKAQEVAWGIEEESCSFEYYWMDKDEDIRYSVAATTVIIKDNGGYLFVDDLQSDYCIYQIKGCDFTSYRILGKNASRYLKKKPLLETGERKE